MTATSKTAPNRAPGSQWLLRWDRRAHVRTAPGDLVVLANDDGDELAVPRRDAKLFANRILQCLEET